MFLTVGYALFPLDNPIKNSCMGSSSGSWGPYLLSYEFVTKFGGQPLLDHICSMKCSTILLKIVILMDMSFWTVSISLNKIDFPALFNVE